MADFNIAPTEPAPGNTPDDMASVFGLDSFEMPSDAPEAAGASVPAAAPPAAPEPGAGVVAPSPVPAPVPAAPAAPTNVAPAPAPAAPEALPPLAAPATGATPQAPAAAPPAAPTPEALELASLRAQVAHLLQAQQQQPSATAPAATPAQPAEEAVRYDLAIPDQLASAIFNEDANVARNGMTHLVNSLATQIHTRLRNEYREELQTFRQEGQRAQQQQTEAQQVETMQQEYYGQFPAHNNPAIKQIVAHEAQQLQAQYPALTWGPDYRNALGARVNATLAALAAPAAPAPSPTPAPTPAPRPAAFASPGTRGAIPAFEGDPQALMNDTFAP